MPKLLLEIPETVESISRPVVHTVIDDLLKWLRIKDRPAIVYLGGSSQPPTERGFGSENAKYNVFNSEARIFIEVTEDYPEYLVGTQAQQRVNEFVEFYDKDLGVSIKPMYQPIQVSVDFKIRTSDKASAQQIQQSWKRLMTGAMQLYHHTVSYHYPLPLEQMAILLEIHKAREAQGGYGDTPGEWFKKCFSKKMTVISDRAGHNLQFVIRENQTGIQGWYDFAAEIPKFDKDADGGSWTATVNYQFQYDRVEGTVLEFPLMVHNQLLPTHLYNTELLPEIDGGRPYRNYSGILAKYFEEYNKPKAGMGIGGVSIPHFDEWIQETKFPHTQTIARIMLQVDPNNRNAILNLGDIGEWELDLRMLKHLKAMGNDIFRFNSALAHITVCEGQTLLDPSNLMISNDLDIFYTKDLALRKNYHFNIAINYNLTALSEKAFISLAKDGALFRQILLMIDPTLPFRGEMPYIQPDGSIRLRDAVSSIGSATGYPGWTGQPVGGEGWVDGVWKGGPGWVDGVWKGGQYGDGVATGGGYYQDRDRAGWNGLLPPILADGSTPLEAARLAAYEAYLSTLSDSFTEGASKRFVGTFIINAHRME